VGIEELDPELALQAVRQFQAELVGSRAIYDQ